MILRILLLSLLFSSPTIAEEYSAGIADFDLSMRYRFGYLDDEAVEKTGMASTLQTLIGIESKKYYDSYAYLQFKNVTNVFAEHFNDGSNNHTRHPYEPDPDTTEINQLYLKTIGIPHTELTLGRQYLEWDNGKFVSTEPWRQNPQTFDGFSLESHYVKDFSLKYAYLRNVNRPLTNKSSMGNYGGTFNLVNANYILPKLMGDVSGYAYFINIRNNFANDLSSKTFGASYKGETILNRITDGVFAKKLTDPELKNLSILYDFEYAKQEDLGGNSTNYSKHYYRFEPSVYWRGLTATLGYEVTSADGVHAFRTALGDTHNFNGYAENFATTPLTGLKDAYVKIEYVFPDKIILLGSSKIYLAYHNFVKYKGRANYGDELDAALKVQLSDLGTAELTYAEFFDNSSFGNSKNIWLSIGFEI